MAACRAVMLKVLLKILLIFCIKGPIKNNNSVCYSFTGVEEIEGIDKLPRFVYESLFLLQVNKSLYLRPLVSLQLLLLLSGDVERCPGPSLADFTKAKGLKIVHQSIRGLFKNFGSFCAAIEKYKHIDIITLSETHITQDDDDEIFEIPGYKFISEPRKNGTGGGVAVYTSEGHKWDRRKDLEPDLLEAICIEIILKNSKNFLLSTIYRPPVSSDYLLENFNELFELFLITANETFNEVIVLGDINVNYLKKDLCAVCKELKAIIASHNFQQLIENPTRITKDTASLIESFSQQIDNAIASTLTAPLSLSYHDLIGCIRKINTKKTQPRTINCRNYSVGTRS